MATRRVKRSGKDTGGDITSLCGDWGSALKATAIREIDSRTNSYYVEDAQRRQAQVRVVQGASGKYLRTDPNSTCSDNLDNLPNC